jgi:hypothetical protein
MSNLLKVLLLEIKFQLSKLKKEKLLVNILASVNMTRIKMSPKRENAHLLPLEIFHMR